MAFDTYTAKMSPLELQPGFQIKFEAIDASTGSAEANVTVSNIVIYPGGSPAVVDELPAGPFMLVPGPGA